MFFYLNYCGQRETNVKMKEELIYYLVNLINVLLQLRMNELFYTFDFPADHTGDVPNEQSEWLVIQLN